MTALMAIYAYMYLIGISWVGVCCTTLAGGTICMQYRVGAGCDVNLTSAP